MLVALVAALFVLVTATAAGARTLEGLVFLSQSSQVVGARALPRSAESIDTSRVPALGAADAKNMLAAFLGQEIDAPLLGKLRDATQAYFASIKQPFVAVIFPAQDITTGVLQVVVTQSRLGTVRVTGSRWFAARQYAAAIGVQPGALLDSAELSADTDWINQNPYRHAVLKAAAGQFPGTTDLTVQAQDRVPISFNAGVDNTGNPATGFERLNTGFDWGNAFGRGDDLNVSYTTSANSASLQQYALSYAATLPERASLILAASTATEHTAIGAPLSTAGINNVFSLRYVQPLKGTSAFKQQYSVGVDDKTSNNNLLFGGVSVFPTTTDVEQAALGYAPSLADRMGTTSARVALFLSPGGLGANNSTAAFSAQTPGALAGYAYGNLTIDRTTVLGPGWNWLVHAELQLADEPLLASEQLSFGGYGSVRGFSSAFATRDNGVLASTEIHPPPLGRGLQPLAFLDFGSGWNHLNFGGGSYLQMFSIGPGLTYQLGSHVSARVDYGFVLLHDGLPAAGGQADLSLQVRS